MNAPGDEDLIRAIRRRLLAEIEKQDSGMDRIVNNVYGGPGMAGKEPSGGGVFDQLQGQDGGDDPFQYYVDIARRNVTDPENPDKVIGWDKSVKRYKKKAMSPE